MPGRATSDVEVTEISRHGFRILLNDRELFLPFQEFPWFTRATVGQILYLYWPELDVDLAVESIEAPGKFPLKAKA